jgi:hypothetical protein
MLYTLAKNAALESIAKAGASGLYDLDDLAKLKLWIETDNEETPMGIIKACELFSVTIE